MKTSRQALYRKLANLYGRMVEGYDQVAQEVGHTCAACPKNCCTSYFQHHTYIEWAYLHQGLKQLPEERRADYVERARAYVEETRAALARGEVPAAMCPLNDEGSCGLYEHRLMICRMHGVPNTLQPPRGPRRDFPGCWRFQQSAANATNVTALDRTPYYKELAALEQALLGKKIGRLPRVDLTLAEMIVAGPPDLSL